MSEMTSIDGDMFPRFEKRVTARWSPILLEPISGGCDRLVVGIVVANEQDFVIKLARDLGKLQCFYGNDYRILLNSIEISESHIMHVFSQMGEKALENYRTVISGVHLGDVRRGEGGSLDEIANSWLGILSSMHSTQAETTAVSLKETELQQNMSERRVDRLAPLVMDYVAERREGLVRFFHTDIRERRARLRPKEPGDVVIDYSGSRLVANFGTMRASSLTNSLKEIKYRLWDLDTHRERESSSFSVRPHEMIIQRPREDDPQITEKQIERLRLAVEKVSHQAKEHDVSFEVAYSVADIGAHLLDAEVDGLHGK